MTNVYRNAFNHTCGHISSLFSLQYWQIWDCMTKQFFLHIQLHFTIQAWNHSSSILNLFYFFISALLLSVEHRSLCFLLLICLSFQCSLVNEGKAQSCFVCPSGFRRKEFRGKLAIAITANFINRNTTAEAKVEEISGVAFIFNQRFFQELRGATGNRKITYLT